MAGYRGHLIGGFVSFHMMYICMKYIGFTFCDPIGLFLITLFGSLFPDVDTKSKGQKYTYGGILLVVLWLIYKKQFEMVSYLSILFTLPLLVKHRGIFHDMRFLLLLTIVCGHFAIRNGLPHIDIIQYGFFFNIGLLSHLLLDTYRFYR